MKLVRFMFLVVALAFASVVSGKVLTKVSSPDGMLTLTTGITQQGQPYYQLQRGKRLLIQPSLLGLQLKDGALDRDFRLLGFTRATKDETWQQPWGEETSVRNHYNELTMQLKQRAGHGRLLTIVFRVFNDVFAMFFRVNRSLPTSLS